MRSIKLGDLTVSRIGLGCMGMSFGYTGAGADDAESIRTIHRALDLGVTLLDTAEIYGPSPTRNWSAEPSATTATRSCWPPSSVSSPTPGAVPAGSTAARPTSAPPLRAR